MPKLCDKTLSPHKPSIKIFRKQAIITIFNYSSIELSEAMTKLLNRDLNFAILPLKLDLTQVLVDFKMFERSVIWHEFWHGREKDTRYESTNFQNPETKPS